MERVSLIIKKLQQLLNDNASADVMLAISQMLVAELQQLQQEGDNLGGVSVIVPRKRLVVEEIAISTASIATKETVIVDEKPVLIEEVPLVVAETVALIEKEPEEYLASTIEIVETAEESDILTSPTAETTLIEQPREEFILETPQEEPEYVEVVPIVAEKPVEATPNEFLFQTNIHSLPTLSQVDTTKTELNELLAKEEKELNSVWSENKIEVAHLHENTHIKDLKRAISINEKYLFINNLFERNEELYDKSIKHIQNFSILPEATFWIQKELKTKLKWSDQDEVVQLFDQFVKRRFS